MAKRYYTLIEHNADGKWSIEFGDYDMECVKQERIDRSESHPFPKLKDLRVITTGERQADIEAAVAKLNV